MVSVNTNSKIYVYCPSNVVTGGTELLHQICDTLNNKGCDTYIVYHPDSNSITPSPYKKYNLNISKEIDDVEGNYLIVPEALIDLGYIYKRLKKIHWWLSVDNFFILSQLNLSPLIYLKLWPKLFLRVLGIKVKYFFKILNSDRTGYLSYNYLFSEENLNLVQSQYAYDFLNKNNFKNLYFVSDYLNNDFSNQNASNRDNVILYNPKKGIEFTKILINKFKDFKWVPIENMTYKEVNLLMQSTKLYVDFGNHPGKDRLPREAVLSGMCIITGIQGSAFYFEDVSIDSKYKFDELNFDFDKFEMVVNNIFNSYEKEYSNFKEYLKLIENSKFKFESEVDDIIKILKLDNGFNNNSQL
ncbi:hypothetical protein [Flavobacterium cellulosilyticum]|uniref:Glycosyltransferase family 1 protein n=1 Tax=Flavobacterium cellulosilyticum TaxID=2541731 RepID=A0A4R5CFH8_9FLAO|nr:hypothetical protein [Flavobacterium cellulosilyticum]TDD98355.1 hypothetical protein E0F76_04225 [Flavobacterium cellulosilyticum]